MMLFPNVIGGISIGIANNSWIARMIAPFIWGIVFMVYTAIARRDKRDVFITNAEKYIKKDRFGMSCKQAFYFIEYMTASSTALIFSILAGVIKSLF